MLAEKHEAMDRLVVGAILQPVGGGDPPVIQGYDLGGQEGAIKTVGDD